MARSHPILALATALYLILIVVLTFVGGDDGDPPSPWWSLVAFLGVGALLTALSSPSRWWVALGFSLLGAAWIEAAQTVWRPPGFASLADLLLGGLGAVIGVVAVVAIRAVSARSSATAAAASHAAVQPRS